MPEQPEPLSEEEWEQLQEEMSADKDGWMSLDQDEWNRFSATIAALRAENTEWEETAKQQCKLIDQLRAENESHRKCLLANTAELHRANEIITKLKGEAEALQKLCDSSMATIRSLGQVLKGGRP